MTHLKQSIRHLLLMAAMPHNRIHDDFDLYMKQLDPDRIEGPAHNGARLSDLGDLTHRMIKERLLTFASEPFLGERQAVSVNRMLSPDELAPLNLCLSLS